MPNLQGLPLELREQIYQYCHVIGIADTAEPITAAGQPLRTSKILHDDALEVLYSKNTFLFKNSSEAMIFFDKIGKDARSCIKHVLIHEARFLEDYGPHMLQWLPNL